MDDPFAFGLMEWLAVLVLVAIVMVLLIIALWPE